MEGKQKKQLISLLLLISCIISVLLLVFTPGPSAVYLRSFGQADSLISNVLDKFNISKQQIRIYSTPLDSIHTRKTYWVAVPPGFSKTQLHLELSHTFLPLNIRAPARVVFPQKDVVIHLVYRNMVFRSVELQTDPDLVMERNYGSILVAFDTVPSDALLEKVIDLGEPVSLALIVEQPEEAKKLHQKLENEYPRLVFWLKDEEGNNVMKKESPHTLSRLHQLQESIPNASVLSFGRLDRAASDTYLRLLSKTSLSYMDVSEAILLDAGAGRSVFQQELIKFAQKAGDNEHPIAIVTGNNESLSWLQNELADFKKAGLEIILPEKRSFSNTLRD